MCLLSSHARSEPDLHALRHASSEAQTARGAGLAATTGDCVAGAVGEGVAATGGRDDAHATSNSTDQRMQVRTSDIVESRTRRLEDT